MNLGRYKFITLVFAFVLSNNLYILAEDKIQSVPLVNLDNLKPSYEEVESDNETDVTINDNKLKKKK